MNRTAVPVSTLGVVNCDVSTIHSKEKVNANVWHDARHRRNKRSDKIFKNVGEVLKVCKRLIKMLPKFVINST